MKKYLFFFLIAINGAVAYATELPKWEIVPTESEITFTATQNGAPVIGSFKKFTADISADLVNYKESHINITIDMASVSTSYADLATTLTTPDWFNIKVFPKAEFKATQFNKKGDKSYEAIGTLTIRDKSVPVTLIFTADIAPENHAVVVGQTTIKRSAFGVGQGEWASTDDIKDDVIVRFKIVANLMKIVANKVK